jgi:hypothetical protein
MTFPKARLAVSACLLVAWLLYLGYLVYETRDVVVLSKPQFMVAQAYLLIDVRKSGRPDIPSEDVTVEKVLWSANAADEKLAGQVLQIADLDKCRKQNGYQGAGKYLVPLMHAVPPYPIAPVPHKLPSGEPAPRVVIYPWTPETQAQLKPFIDAKK